ncbi:glycosyltransferase family 87 protein [Pseudarthrobacter sp. AL07]|uniref:glycosyltransferase family 87 protein n=1 Tax=unclassified Pseudarthrobacter TaxID=2647000 RepID=UPI002499C92E|nr:MULTISPECIES: glycosyltransferase family 87 protein [unclassified Pseudarthrobacter]MDI3196047.1 glycosyltransferase family 87 protein [Pseudarthrobacter sp. AL20]MDI3210118.1 glycosyltransferase family 87 protein [Pseudarthrobacter sp. AL07]
MPLSDKDSAISTDAFFATLTRIRNVVLPAAARSWLNTPRGLLTGFILVHLGFLIFAALLSLRGEAFSDTFIYRDWARAGFDEANLSGGPSPWVYPILALIPMALAGLAGPGPFFFLWVLMTTILNGWGLAKLTDRGRNQNAIPAGWWWLIFTLLMGWLGFARVDGLTAPIVMVALAYGVGRPFIASILLATATWVKVWPAAVMLALFAVVKNRLLVVLAGVATSAVVVALAAAIGSVPKLLNFLTQQGDRGMQLEATFTTPWLWLSVLNIGDSRMYMNTDINSMQVDGPGTAVMSVLMQPLLILAALLVAGLTFWALHNGKLNGTGKADGGVDRTELLLAGALTLATAFVVFNKVGSPQFMVWLAPAVAVGLAHSWREWRVPAAMLIAIAVATFFIYPLFYDALSHNNPVMAGVLTIRNVLLVVLFLWSVRRLYSLGKKTSASVPALKES